MARKTKIVDVTPPPSTSRGLTHKMTDYEKNLMFEYLARGYSCVQVAKALEEYDGVKISDNNVKYYKKTYPDEINKRRNLRHDDLVQSLHVDKQSRIQRLTVILDTMEDENYIYATDKNNKLVNIKEYTDLMRQIAQEVGDLVEIKEYRHMIAIANLEPGFWDDNKDEIEEKMKVARGGENHGGKTEANKVLQLPEGEIVE